MTTSFRFQPDTIIRPEDPNHVKQVVNKNIQRLATAHQTLDGTAIKAPTLGAGFVVDAGTETFTGSKTAIKTQLTTISRVVASINNGSTATNFIVTSRVNPTDGKQIDLFVWQPTAAGNTTPIACTTSVTVHWWATGTSTATE